jgi:isoleucyl-tRNA synthetase
VVEAGRRARSEANIKLRQPIRKVIVRGGEEAAGHVEDIKSELRVKEVVFDEETQVEVTIKPNFPIAGPRLGSKVKEVAAALANDAYEIDERGNVSAAGEELTPEEVIRTERVVLDGWIAAHDGDISVAIDPDLDEELIKEGRALELIRLVNDQRKQVGLELTDRISLRLPPKHEDLVEAYREWIASEVLATSIEIDESLDEPQLAMS